MKKTCTIIVLIFILILLTTYSPKQLNLDIERNNNFFKIENIIINNNNLVDKEKMIKKLNDIKNKNIFLIKKEDIEQALNEIHFLEKVEVKKIYPNTIIIKIIETKPVAIFFQGKNKYFLDSLSNLIPYNETVNNNELPILFGKNANNYFVIFLNQLEVNSFPIGKIKDLNYFQAGRWDLVLKDNKIIKLPYNATNKIIKKSIELLNRKDFKNYNIIDLRVDGKIIVQ